MATHGIGKSAAWKMGSACQLGPASNWRREISMSEKFLQDTLPGVLTAKGVSFVLEGNQREVHDAIECCLQRALSKDGKAYLQNDGKMAMASSAKFVRPAGSNSAWVQSVDWKTVIGAMVRIVTPEEGKSIVVNIASHFHGNSFRDWSRLSVALCAEFACLQHHATSGKHLMPGFYAGYTSYDSVGREMGMARRMTLKLRVEYSDEHMRMLTQELSVMGVVLLRWRKPQQYNPHRYMCINMAHISQQCEVELLASDIALGEILESGLVLGVDQKPYNYTPLLAKREEAIAVRRKAALDAFLVEREQRFKKAGGAPKRVMVKAVDEIKANAKIILMAREERLNRVAQQTREAEAAKVIFPKAKTDDNQAKAAATAAADEGSAVAEAEAVPAAKRAGAKPTASSMAKPASPKPAATIVAVVSAEQVGAAAADVKAKAGEESAALAPAAAFDEKIVAEADAAIEKAKFEVAAKEVISAANVATGSSVLVTIDGGEQSPRAGKGGIVRIPTSQESERGCVSQLEPTPTEQRAREQAMKKVKAELIPRIIDIIDAFRVSAKGASPTFDRTSLANTLASNIVATHHDLEHASVNDDHLQIYVNEHISKLKNSPPRPPRGKKANMFGTSPDVNKQLCVVCNDEGSLLPGGTHIQLLTCVMCKKYVHYSARRATKGEYCCSLLAEGKVVCSKCGPSDSICPQEASEKGGDTGLGCSE